MKKKLLPLIIAAGIASSAAPIISFASGSTSLGEQILNKAKSKFVSKVGSLLVDAIFGFGGPDYVNLSEASLQEIQNRVRKELVNAAEQEFLRTSMPSKTLLTTTMPP